MSINTEKIRQNADLINPISACPFGEPIAECPFIPFYTLNDEREQIMQIDVIPQTDLDELRKFHRACMERYRSGEWKPKKPCKQARDLYEGGIRVPIIACWPGSIKAGSTTDHVSAFWDVMPTITDLAGVKSPENIDGISFLPTLLEKNEQKKHDYLYWEFHELGAVRQSGRTTGNWFAIRC